MHQKSILIIGHEASLSGAPKSLLYFAKWLKTNKQYTIYFILQRGGELLDEYEKIGSVFIWNRNYEDKKLLERLLNRLYDYEQKRKEKFLFGIKNEIDTIYCNTCTNGEIIESVKNIISKPLITRIPELEYVIRLFKTLGKVKNTFEQSDAIIAVAEAVKTNLIANHQVPASKIHVCYGAIPPPKPISQNKSSLKKSLGISEHDFVIGGCGSLIWRKGYDLFIQTAKLAKDLHPTANFKFLWVGGKENSNAMLEAQRELELLELVDRVIFQPSIPNVEDYYQLMDVFFMTSREDPFPLVNLEAASFGLPIICFDKSGGSTEFVNEEIGFVAPYEDLEFVVDKISLLNENSSLLQNLSIGAKEKSKQFNMEKSANEIFGVIQKIIK
ncbi:glycosyltransferase family 4 protein [Flammeovirgaceae bacterium SG7u.111]|nr:glycosyltransferase family 4 protein [Flammeovirgaceae bacterium SG7u.132]WPO34976.1 glycosyltransferase family 4 protein [Flammeovirgaceae bacterium SG7u.111]